MSGGDFEKTLQDYVRSVEHFVATMHDGLADLSARAEAEEEAQAQSAAAGPAAEPTLSQDLDAAAAVRLEEAERHVRDRLGELEETASELQATTAALEELERREQSRAAEFEVQSAALQEKSAALEDHISRLQAKEEEIARLQAQIAEFAQQRLNAIETPEDSRDLQEIVDLRNQVAELQALRSQVSELQSLREEAVELRRQAEQVSRLQAQASQLQSRVEELETRNLELETAPAPEPVVMPAPAPAPVVDTSESDALRARVAELEEQLARAKAARPLSSVTSVFGTTSADEFAGEEEDAGTDSIDDSDEHAPSAPATRPRRAPAPKPAVKFSDTKKVLVVEGTEIYRVLFGRYFQGLPIQIRFARNADEAERIQSESSFDLVVTDWNAQLKQGLPKHELVERVLSRLES